MLEGGHRARFTVPANRSFSCAGASSDVLREPRPRCTLSHRHTRRCPNPPRPCAPRPGAAGFLILSQWADRPARYGDPSRFDMMPSQLVAPSARAANGLLLLPPLAPAAAVGLDVRRASQPAGPEGLLSLASGNMAMWAPNMRESIGDSLDAVEAVERVGIPLFSTRTRTKITICSA
jgi:hypothetical protein